MPRPQGKPVGTAPITASPSQNPGRFRGQVRNHFRGLGNQLGGGFGGGGRANILEPQGGRGGRRRPGRASTYVPGDQTATPVQPDMGEQAFGTYAPDIDAGQFVKEDYKKLGLKGNTKLGTSNPFGGFGGIGGMGGGFGGGGGGFGDPMAFVEMLMSLMGQMGGQEDQGPYRGK